MKMFSWTITKDTCSPGNGLFGLKRICQKKENILWFLEWLIELIMQIISSDGNVYLRKKMYIIVFTMKISNKLVAFWNNSEPLFLGKCIYTTETDRICFYMQIIGGCCIISSRDSWIILYIKKRMLKLYIWTKTDWSTRRQGKESNEDIEG